MAPNADRASPERPARHVIHPAKGSDVVRVHRIRDELAVRRELRSWQRAAEHLNALGYAAAVPAQLADRLRRRGLAVWTVSDWGAA